MVAEDSYGVTGDHQHHIGHDGGHARGQAPKEVGEEAGAVVNGYKRHANFVRDADDVGFAIGDGRHKAVHRNVDLSEETSTLLGIGQASPRICIIEYVRQPQRQAVDQDAISPVSCGENGNGVGGLVKRPMGRASLSVSGDALVPLRIVTVAGSRDVMDVSGGGGHTFGEPGLA